MGNSYVYFCFEEAISHSAGGLWYLISERQQLKWPHSHLAIPVNISDCEYVTLFCCDSLKIAEVHEGLAYVPCACKRKT